jgi:hypothetical protein
MTLRVGMRFRSSVAAFVLAGCAQRYALDEVSIEGGTDEQRSAILAELERFERWIGAGRVELAGIEVSEGPGGQLKDHAGRYDRLTARIQLSGDLHPSVFPLTLRHELCHALDAQENLLVRPVPAFDDVASRILHDEDHPLNGNLGSGRRRHRAEVFAYVCQQAPLGTALLARPCPGESDEYAEVATWINDKAWTAAPDISPKPLESMSPPVGPWRVPFEATALEAIGSQSLDAVILYATGDEPGVQKAVSTLDGSDAPFFQDLTLGAITDGYEAVAPYRAPELGHFSMSVQEPIDAVSDGEVTLRIVRGLRQPDLDVVSAPHVLVGPLDDAWSLLDGACPSEASSVFIANGRLHVAWAGGSSVWWARIE